jgi:hypothetical protein
MTNSVADRLPHEGFAFHFLYFSIVNKRGKVFDYCPKDRHAGLGRHAVGVGRVLRQVVTNVEAIVKRRFFIISIYTRGILSAGKDVPKHLGTPCVIKLEGTGLRMRLDLECPLQSLSYRF